MLKLYAVRVWRVNEPSKNETIWVRTHTARHAQHLAIESHPGCNADTIGVLVKGTWTCPGHDE
jgi:hypothetical protein